MKKIKIAIIGRPNVGKSCLFNRLIGKRVAIVDEMEGVTRDRLYFQFDFFGKNIELIDTGGIDVYSNGPFQKHINAQAHTALNEADGIIMVVDGTTGPTQLDERVARELLRLEKPVALAVNKVDTFKQDDYVHEFYGLGIPHMVGVSALHGNRVAELLEMTLGIIDEEAIIEELENASGLKVAIIGRPNTGKSTLMNQILREERCVVSEIAGTTRDSVDVNILIKDQEITLIDTAGIRRKKSEHEAVEKFAAIRTERAIERSDICILMLDATQGLTAQEKGMITQIEKEGKGLVLFFNKWDLVSGFRMEHCLKALSIFATFTEYCPVIFGSAKTGRNLDKLFDAVFAVKEMMKLRISTGQLNKFIEKATQKVHAPMIQGKRLRIYYMTQVSTQPTKFVFFVNYAERMSTAYKRYIINEFRKAYQFTGVPLFFSLRERDAKTLEERLEGKTEVESTFVEQTFDDIEHFESFDLEEESALT